MIKLWWGNNEEGARDAWREAVARARSEYPGATFFSINGDDFRPTDLAEWLEAKSLFTSEPLIVAADHWLDNKEARSVINHSLAALKSSSNWFLFLERGEDDEVFAALAAAAGESRQFTAPKGESRGVWSPFPLTDALLAGDRKVLWLRLTDALIFNQVPAEEVFWRLFWQVKTLLLVANDPAAARRSLKPFVFQKTSSALRHFSPRKLENLLEQLLDCLRGARTGGLDLDLALERFALGVGR